eukprot:256371-Prorocentrum_minimum.AAC.4
MAARSAHARVHLSQPFSCSRTDAGRAHSPLKVLASKTSRARVSTLEPQKSPPSGLNNSRVSRRLSAYVAARAGPKRALAIGRSAVNAVVAADANSVKEALRTAIAPTDRGIFGCQKAERAQIAELIEQLEALNPLPAPMESLEKVGPKQLHFQTETSTDLSYDLGS